MSAHNSSNIPVMTGERAESACWSCGDMRAAHFCEGCGKLQPPAPTDYFSFFGLPRKLDLDTAILEREFYQLSRKLHPDVYARASDQEREWSLQKSSQLNDAYRTLRDPIARTEYLLRLQGVQLEEQSKAASDKARESGSAKKQIVPPELLEEVFEFNMQLEEARASKQTGDMDEALTRELSDTKSRLEGKYAALDQELRADWKEWDSLLEGSQAGDVEAVPEQERRSVIHKMVNLLNRRSYIRNLVRDVNDLLET